jgi:hypothetical protein
MCDSASWIVGSNASPGSTDLLHFGVGHNHDPVAHGHGLNLVVGDVDGGCAQAKVQSLDFGPHILPEVGIQSSQRLVHQERLRSSDQGAGQGYPLLIPATQLAGPHIQQMADLQHLDHFTDPSVDFVAGFSLGLQGKGDILPGRHVGVQGEELKDKGNVAVAGVEPGHFAFIQINIAAGDRLQARNHAQSRGFAAARRAEQDHKLAIVDGQVHRLDRVKIAEHFFDLF